METKKTNFPLAAGLMILSGLSFALMALFVKGSNDLPLMERVLFRNLVIIILPLSLWWKKGDFSLWGQRENRLLLVARSLFGFAGVVGYFYAISHLNLADSAMLNRLSPFFVTLFAALFLKERITSRQLVALVTAFTGALLVIKPRLDYTILPALGGLLSGIMAGAAYTIIRGLHNRQERSEVILFYFSLISVILSGLTLVGRFVVPSFRQTLSLLAIGIFAAGGQLFLTLAYKFAEASKVSIYSYTNIVFSSLLGFLVWSEIPDRWSLLGGVIIIGTALWLFNAQRRGS